MIIIYLLQHPWPCSLADGPQPGDEGMGLKKIKSPKAWQSHRKEKGSKGVSLQALWTAQKT